MSHLGIYLHEKRGKPGCFHAGVCFSCKWPQRCVCLEYTLSFVVMMSEGMENNSHTRLMPAGLLVWGMGGRGRESHTLERHEWILANGISKQSQCPCTMASKLYLIPKVPNEGSFPTRSPWEGCHSWAAAVGLHAENSKTVTPWRNSGNNGPLTPPSPGVAGQLCRTTC